MNPRAFLLTAALMTALTTTQADPAGSVVYAFGDAKVVDASGQSMPVKKGTEVSSGQTLQTQNGRMQVRFADGGFIAVQPNTQFKIDEFSYAGAEDGSERSFFNLVKGGIRFVTGAIGHRNRQNYRIRTTVATIGIRGSAGRAEMCVGGSCGGRPDGLFVTGNDDTLVVINQTGQTPIGTGQTYHTTCDTCQPNEVDQGPDAFSAVEGDGDQEALDETTTEEAESPDFLAGNEYGAEDGPQIIEDAELPPKAGGPFALVFVSDISGETGTAIDTKTDAVPFRQVQETIEGVAHTAKLETGEIADFVSLTEAEVFLQRWTNGSFSEDFGGEAITSNLSGNQSVHFAYGPPAQAIPPLGTDAVAVYAFAGGTPSTTGSGTGPLGQGVTGGSLSLDFLDGSIGLAMIVAHGGTDYLVGGSTVLAPMMGPDRLYNLFAFDDALAFNSTAGPCTNGCSTAIDGFFAGETMSSVGLVPSGAGLTYQIQTADPLSGAAGFQFGGVAPGRSE